MKKLLVLLTSALLLSAFVIPAYALHTGFTSVAYGDKILEGDEDDDSGDDYPTAQPTSPPTMPTDAPEIILGDADGDGEVTIIDATAIQRVLAELPTASYNEKAADADADGEVTIMDATAVQRHVADLPANENIGKPIQ